MTSRQEQAATRRQMTRKARGLGHTMAPRWERRVSMAGGHVYIRECQTCGYTIWFWDRDNDTIAGDVRCGEEE